ncbi:MAG: iron-containing alcohol dehydrogenase [Clostridiales bacterium]|nr:iron-containing alcohol dehydrogenase [Clostridiales bacterium]
MDNFIYEVPTRVYFGRDQLAYLGGELGRFGKNVLLCYGGGSIKRNGLYDKLAAQIKAAGLTPFELGGIDPNPRVSSVREGAALCRKHKIDVLLAAGGGSVIDCAKFIGAAAFYEGDAWEILTKKPRIDRCLPLVTVLTAAAAGSETDSFGVISNPDTNDKIGWGYSVMTPKVSFLDPSNTYTVNAFQTACGAADILSHIVEVYFAPGDTFYMLDAVMEGLMKTVVKFAPAALKNPTDYEARANLMWASSWAINGFISGGADHAWSCHPVEHELSAHYDIAHGAGLAVLTPRWMEYVLDEKTAPRFKRFGVNVFDLDPAVPAPTAAQAAIESLKEFLFTVCRLPANLTALNIDSSKFPVMAQKACRLGDLKYAYKPLAPRDVENILNMCL